jgi:hypothetical protein
MPRLQETNIIGTKRMTMDNLHPNITYLGNWELVRDPQHDVKGTAHRALSEGVSFMVEFTGMILFLYLQNLVNSNRSKLRSRYWCIWHSR